MDPISPSELRAYPVFRGCGDEELNRLIGCMSRTLLSVPGQVLFEEEVDSDAAYLVKQGTLVAELPLGDGVALEMARMGTGSVVGELCLIKGGPRSLRVKATERTELLRVDRAKFEALRNEKDIAAYTIIRNICLTMCDRLRNTNEFIERELRHEAPLAADFTGTQHQSIADRAREYLSKLFGRGDD